MVISLKSKILIFLFIVCMTFAGCGNQDTTSEASSTTEVKKQLSQAEQVDELLQGTWKSIDADNVYSLWTFHDGSYVCDTYVNDEKLDNSSMGTYSIGSDAIHTLTSDQKNNVEGSIPFTFNNGELSLNGATGSVEKID